VTFTRRNWHNKPQSDTPVSAIGLDDLEARIANADAARGNADAALTAYVVAEIAKETAYIDRQVATIPKGATGDKGDIGPTGPVGPPGPPGVGASWQGEWLVGTTYVQGDGVDRNRRLYISNVDDNTGNDPATDNGTNWAPLRMGDLLVTALQMGDYTASVDDYVIVYAPAAGATITAPPAQSEADSKFAVKVLDSSVGPVTVEAPPPDVFNGAGGDSTFVLYPGDEVTFRYTPARVAASYDDTVLATTGGVAFWQFDESASATIADSRGSHPLTLPPYVTGVQATPGITHLWRCDDAADSTLVDSVGAYDATVMDDAYQYVWNASTDWNGLTVWWAGHLYQSVSSANVNHEPPNPTYWTDLGAGLAYQPDGWSDTANVTFGVPGRIDAAAILFDQTDQNTFKKIVCHDGPIVGALPDWTVEAWIKTSNGTYYQCFYNETPAAGYAGNDRVRVALRGGQIHVHYQADNGSTPGVYGWAGAGPNLADGAWHHVAAVRDSTTGFRVYADGVRVGNDASSGAVLTTFTDAGVEARIGNAHYESTFFGAVQAVATYDVALDDATVAQHAALGSPGAGLGQKPGALVPSGDPSSAWLISGPASTPDATDLRFTGNLTIEGWIRPTGFDDPQVIASKRSGADGYELGVNADGHLYFTAGGSTVTDSATLDLNRWQHTVVTLTGTTAQFYIDGTATGSGTAGPPTSSTTDLNVGSIGAKAWLQDLALYSTALSPAAVLAHYQAGVEPSAGNWFGDSYDSLDWRYVRSGELFVNVKDPPYNAKGDGVTDDTAALRAAFAEISTWTTDIGFSPSGHKYSHGGVLWIPPGVYRLTEHLSLSGVSGVHIKGAPQSATILRKDDAEGALLELTSVGDCVLEDITFVANNGGMTTPLVKFGASGTDNIGCRVERCKFIAFQPSGVEGADGLLISAAIIGTVRDCSFQYFYNDLRLGSVPGQPYVNAYTIDNCAFNNSTNAHILIDTRVQSINITNNTFENLGNRGAIGGDGQIDSMVISGNWFGDAGGDGNPWLDGLNQQYSRLLVTNNFFGDNGHDVHLPSVNCPNGGVFVGNHFSGPVFAPNGFFFGNSYSHVTGGSVADGGSVSVQADGVTISLGAPGFGWYPMRWWAAVHGFPTLSDNDNEAADWNFRQGDVVVSADATENARLLVNITGNNDSESWAPIPGMMKISYLFPGAAFDLAYNHLGTRIRVSGAYPVNIPAHSRYPLPQGCWFEIMQDAGGQIAVTADGGVTLHSPGGYVKTRTNWSVIRVQQITQDEWVISGDVGA
jgi:Concanavalin A-like lectin/glucanases superfamily/Pectate lyase superfamily protein